MQSYDPSPSEPSDIPDDIPDDLPVLRMPAKALAFAHFERGRLMDEPEIAKARAHIRETLRRWAEEARTSGIPF